MKKNFDEILGSELTVTCGNDVLACGCESIVSYSDECVSLQLCDMILHVYGCSLTMKSYYGRAVRVYGHIEGLRFEK